MEVVPIEIFGVAVDVPLGPPQAFASARIDEFASKLCDHKVGMGLRSDQVKLRKFDDLFDYELKVQFFGENGTLTRTADRAKLAIRNARTSGDWSLLQQSFVRFYQLLNVDPLGFSILSTHAHAKFSSPEERDAYLGEFSAGPLINRPAGLGYVEIADWEKEIRVMIERSNVVPNAIFVAWDTQFPNNQDWESFLSTLPTMMENAANMFELGFEPLREKV